MPQPTSSPKPDASRREQLAKLLDPLGLVVLTREKLLEAFEDAVQRGRMTRDDAQDLATALVNRSRQSTEDLLADVERLLGLERSASARGAAEGAQQRRPPRQSSPRLPISGYDDLTAAQITSRLGDLTPAQLRRVRDHERRNANRKSVLQAVERKLA